MSRYNSCDFNRYLDKEKKVRKNSRVNFSKFEVLTVAMSNTLTYIYI